MINLVEIPLAILLMNPDGTEMSMMDLFHAGKEIMWPILLLSFVGITVVVERLLFIIRENGTREAQAVEKMLELVEKRDIAGALAIGKKSKDFIARILVYTLTNKEYSMSNAFVRASGQELGRFSQFILATAGPARRAARPWCRPGRWRGPVRYGPSARG